MSIAQDIIDYAEQEGLTIAQAFNNRCKGGVIDTVDFKYKFYYCNDGSKIGVDLKSKEYWAVLPPKVEVG